MNIVRRSLDSLNIYAACCSIYFTLLILCTICSTSKSMAAAPTELYRLLLDAELNSIDADNEMIDRMTECNELLSRHYRYSKNLPQSLLEFENIVRRSKLSGAKNPYFNSELLGRELPPTTSHRLQFEIVADYGLSRNGLDACAKHPPKTWRGSPGSIVIAQNSENLFAVRGYGMDGKPILDRTTNSVFYIFKDCSNSD